MALDKNYIEDALRAIYPRDSIYGIYNTTISNSKPKQPTKEIKMLDWKIKDESTGATVKRSTLADGSLQFNLTGHLSREDWKALKAKVDELYDYCEPEE